MKGSWSEGMLGTRLNIAKADHKSKYSNFKFTLVPDFHTEVMCRNYFDTVPIDVFAWNTLNKKSNNLDKQLTNFPGRLVPWDLRQRRAPLPCKFSARGLPGFACHGFAVENLSKRVEIDKALQTGCK